MCGVCGVIGPGAGREEGLETVRAMMRALAHRGPDDEGLASGPDHCLGHRRLAIIDLERGRQPMYSEDTRTVLVYNGEIYNYLELRQELTRKGCRFATFSDTEVLLRAWETWGRDCLNRLSGMFAFALWDDREKTLFAARDHFGIKPFYYARTSSGLAFASEIKALFHHPDVRPGLDGDALRQYLVFQFCLNGRTLFDRVQRLEPAHWLSFRPADGRLETGRYWAPSYEIDVHHTEEYFTDRLLLLLQDSVRSQLRSDVPLGAYLSGGLDSSTVATLAASGYGAGLQTFTGRFAEGEAYDESAYARAVAEHLGCAYHEVAPTAADFVEDMPRLIRHMDEPCAGPGLFPQYRVSRLARERVTVVLGGQGGDELFGGYARYLVAYLEQCLKGAIFESSEGGRHVVTLESIIPSLPLLQKYAPMLSSFWSRGLFEDMDRRYFHLIDRSRALEGLLRPEVFAPADREAVFEEFRPLFNQPELGSLFNKMTSFDQRTLLPALLQVEDRVSMAVSLESRVPLLDVRIAELAASMPPTMKFQEGCTKSVLKRAMQSQLAPRVLARQDKMGFPVPLGQWLAAGPVREFVLDLLGGADARMADLVRPGEAGRLLGSEGAFGRGAWALLCLELWMREFL